MKVVLFEHCIHFRRYTMEVKKLEQVDSTVVANGVVAMGCDSDCLNNMGK